MHLDKTLLITAIVCFTACETGLKNRTTTNDMNNNGTASGIIQDTGTDTFSKTTSGKSSEIKKIFSNSGVPGYYIQVGHFKDNKPDSSFINKMKQSGLEYDIVEKYQSGRPNYYALIGPYRSYNEAKRVEEKGRAKSISYGTFIVQIERP